MRDRSCISTWSAALQRIRDLQRIRAVCNAFDSDRQRRRAPWQVKPTTRFVGDGFFRKGHRFARYTQIRIKYDIYDHELPPGSCANCKRCEAYCGCPFDLREICFEDDEGEPEAVYVDSQRQ